MFPEVSENQFVANHCIFKLFSVKHYFRFFFILLKCIAMPCTMNWYLFAKYSKSVSYLQQSTVISHIGKMFW